MKVTIKSSIITAFAMIILLIIALMILTVMRIDRKVVIPGAFTYRNISPVVVEESGFVDSILISANSVVSENDTIIILRNTDLEMDIENTRSKIMIYRIELEEILQLKEIDISLSSFNTTKLKEQLKVLKQETGYLSELVKDKSDLYEKKIVSKDEYEKAKIALKQKELAIRSTEIQINELSKSLQKLDTSTYLSYQLKEKELAIEQDRLDYMNRRKKMLTIKAKTDGKLVAEKLDRLLNIFLTKGDRIGDIVSQNEIDFLGYATGTDIIRLEEGQKSFFNVETFRGKDFIRGRVKNIGLKPENFEGEVSFPIEIEVIDKEFFDRGRKRYIHAGVVGDAVIITEENIPIFRLIIEQMIRYADVN